MGRKIYHITHVDNLPSIIADGCLWSDAERIRRRSSTTTVGMHEIKRRRLEELTVKCHPDTMVGEYVPFYFCPRSVMLFLLHCGNHPGLDYTEGQDPIVHLEADLSAVIQWARGQRRPWAFTRANAGARYTQFFNRLDDLDGIDWTAVRAHDWTAPHTKERKQAEFLLHQSCPWDLVSRIGVRTPEIRTVVRELLSSRDHRPRVSVLPSWYY